MCLLPTSTQWPAYCKHADRPSPIALGGASGSLPQFGRGVYNKEMQLPPPTTTHHLHMTSSGRLVTTKLHACASRQ